VIRIRPEQMEAFRGERREALAERLAARGARLYPEKVAGRRDAELRAEARRIAASAREWGLTSERDATIYYDLSLELGEEFERGEEGRWAREHLEDRRRGPHERIVAVRDAYLEGDVEDPFAEDGAGSRPGARGR
jgi:hypothetical protein